MAEHEQCGRAKKQYAILEDNIQQLQAQSRWVCNYQDRQDQSYPVGSGLVERAVAIVINMQLPTGQCHDRCGCPY